eukprot:s2250_g2.t2
MERQRGTLRLVALVSLTLGSHEWLVVQPVAIETKGNNAFKVLRKLGTRQGRRKVGRFLAEGETFLRMQPRSVFLRQSRFEEEGLAGLRSWSDPSEDVAPARPVRPLLWGGGLPYDAGHAELAAPAVAVLRNELFDQISSQEKSQGVLCVFGMPQEEAPSETTDPRVVVLDGVEDPNNLGVILRTMEAFGSRTLLVTKGTVDVYNEKVVRCSMGAVVRQRVQVHEVLPSELMTLLPDYQLFATDLSMDRPAVPSWRLAEYLSGRDAFVFGNEARGVSEEVLALSHERLRIPMAPGIDSLNVGVSVGVVLHEALGAAVQAARARKMDIEDLHLACLASVPAGGGPCQLDDDEVGNGTWKPPKNASGSFARWRLFSKVTEMDRMLGICWGSKVGKCNVTWDLSRS